MPRIRRKFTIALSVCVLSLILLMYLLIGQSIGPANSAKPSASAANYQQIANKLQHLESDLSRHSEEVAKVQQQIDILQIGGLGVAAGDSPAAAQRLSGAEMQREDVIQAAAAANSVNRGRCQIGTGSQRQRPNNTVQMLSVYDQLPFDNPDGGAWKQGWRLEADEHQWNAAHPLRVFVVPHSHNDPGWIKTFDEYYEQQTKSILDTLLQQMSDNPEQTFIWAEISYFARWYEKLKSQQALATRQLVRSGRLEFVTGGWVMADEANSHWLALLQQLTEGHVWLRQHLNVTPTASWSIDPFGSSPTMPWLLRKAGLQNLLIQRSHYAIKKRLATVKQLEFRWRQLWDGNGETELFTHMMPFYSYDVPHTCGPDPKICCQFDFKRLPGYGLHCPWNVPPQVITESNVAQRAQLILDQWRKKSTLYRTRAVLIPLGDDFRYTQSTEWEAQRSNYQRLFDHLNGEPRLHVHAKFGTLSEYFAAVHEERGAEQFPTLSGDFFTYADRDDHYWSGYFTSRPYHKRLDRVLMAVLRSAELLHSWSRWPEAEAGLERRLQAARRALSLFQHHDGVTGTGRDYVMRDYADRMLAAIADCRHVIQQAAYRQLTREAVYQPDYQFTYFHLDDARQPPAAPSAPGSGALEAEAAVAVDSRPTIILGAELPTKYVVVHNSLPQQRDELVEVLVSNPTVRVTDAQQQPVPAQVSPVWSWHRDSLTGGGGDGMAGQSPQASSTKFRLMWRAKVAPLGLRTYIVHSTASVQESLDAATTYARLELYPSSAGGGGGGGAEQRIGDYPNAMRIITDAAAREVQLSVDDGVAVAFGRNGMLKAVMPQGGGNEPVMPVNLRFMRYGTRQQRGQERSGAYLFLPNGEASEMPLGGGGGGTDGPTILVERGELESRCAVGAAFGVHETILRTGAAGATAGGMGVALEIRNLVDIRPWDNTELAMRLHAANIASGDTFFTDLNGAQIIRRRRLNKLPLQANYYPVPSAIYVEDAGWRMTLLSGQPLGGSSLASGQLEVMQDRRLLSDDNRGLGQGVLDNRPVLNVFRLVVESLEGCGRVEADTVDGQLTVAGFAEQQRMLHPLEKLIWYETVWTGAMPSFGDEREPMEADMQVAVARNLAQVSAKPKGGAPAANGGGSGALGLVVHRTQLRACSSDAHRSGTFNVRRVFGLAEDRPIHAARITLLQRDEALNGADDIDMCPMDIKAFVISR